MSKTNPLPAFGRTVTVEMIVIGDVGTKTEFYYVALGDEQQAVDAVKKHLDFAPNEDRKVAVRPPKLPQNAMAGVGMTYGGEIRLA